MAPVSHWADRRSRSGKVGPHMLTISFASTVETISRFSRWRCMSASNFASGPGK